MAEGRTEKVKITGPDTFNENRNERTPDVKADDIGGGDPESQVGRS